MAELRGSSVARGRAACLHRRCLACQRVPALTLALMQAVRCSGIRMPGHGGCSGAMPARGRGDSCETKDWTSGQFTGEREYNIVLTVAHEVNNKPRVPPFAPIPWGAFLRATKTATQRPPRHVLNVPVTRHFRARVLCLRCRKKRRLEIQKPALRQGC